jgi:N-terminal domain of toast_rack, DUF2154/Domain of unknown function (DUF5668)
MDGSSRSRYRGSVTGAMILIAVGIFFLILNLHPNIDLWPIMFRYWPLILIFIGVGKIFDSLIFADRTGTSSGDHVSGISIALVVLILIFGLALWRGNKMGSNSSMHDTHEVELLGAKSVSADVQMPAGQLTLTGGASRLLDADFNYREDEGKPSVDYSVSGDHGQLRIRQEREHLHLGTARNTWNLRFGGNEPLDLKLNMGAGQSDLNFRGLELHHLEVNIGAGQMTLDLTGPRKSDLEAIIEGGVGSATIRLPKQVGVHVHASGGIGSIATDGLARDGDAYVNASYGKSPITINLEVHGGVGEIDLQSN